MMDPPLGDVLVENELSKMQIGNLGTRLVENAQRKCEDPTDKASLAKIVNSRVLSHR